MKECEPLVSAREPPGPRAPRRRTVLCIAGIAATALGARRVLAPSVTSVSALAASAIDDDVFRVGNHSVFWRATHNGTTTRWAQRQNATYRAVATSNASSNASAGDEVFYNGIYVTELVSVLNNPPYSTDDFWCDIDFAYCGRASCTRHAKDKHGKAGVEVAACSCEPVASGSGNYAKLELADLPALSLLAQSSEFVEVMRNYVEGYHSYDDTRELLCDGLSGGRFLSKLAPRSISLPASDADDFGTASSSSYSYSYDEVVEVHRCEHNVAIAVCSGAPCYDDDKTTTKGHLTRTCLWCARSRARVLRLSQKRVPRLFKAHSLTSHARAVRAARFTRTRDSRASSSPRLTLDTCTAAARTHTPTVTAPGRRRRAALKEACCRNGALRPSTPCRRRRITPTSATAAIGSRVDCRPTPHGPRSRF